MPSPGISSSHLTERPSYASLPPRGRFSHAWSLPGLSHGPITCVMQGSWTSRCSTKANGVSECLNGSSFSSPLRSVTNRCHPTKLVLEAMLPWAAFMNTAWFYYPSWPINSFCRHGSSPVYTYPCSKQFSFIEKIWNISLNHLFFNWRIIALQCCVAFHCTTAWVNDEYTYVVSLLNLPAIPHPIPPL